MFERRIARRASFGTEADMRGLGHGQSAPARPSHSGMTLNQVIAVEISDACRGTAVCQQRPRLVESGPGKQRFFLLCTVCLG